MRFAFPARPCATFSAGSALRHRALAVALLAGLTSGCGESATSPQAAIAGAREAETAQELARSLVDLRSAAQAAPDNAELRLALARLHLKMMNAANAEKDADKARTLGAPVDETILLQARALFLAGKHDELLGVTVPTEDSAARAEVLALQAEAHLERDDRASAHAALEAARTDAPTALPVRMAAARLEAAEGDVAGALAALEALLEDAPDHGRAWSVLARFHEAQGDKEAAIAALGKAIPNLYIAVPERYRLALLFIEKGDYESAEPVVEAVLAQAPDDPRAQFAAGLLAFGKREFTQSAAHFVKINEPARALLRSVNYYDGVTALALDKPEQALQKLEIAREAFPESPDVNYHLALAHLEIGDVAGAEQVLQAYLVHDPLNPQVLELLGKLTLAEGRADEGIGYLRQVIDLKGDSAPLLLELGQGLLAAGRVDESLVLFDQVAELDDAAGAEGSVGALLASGRVEQARVEVDRLLAEAPDTPLAHNLDGLVKLREARGDAAKEAFARAIELDGDYLPAVYNLVLAELNGLEIDAAKSHLASALTAHPRDLRLRLLAADAALRENDVATARGHLEVALESAPQHPAANLAMAQALIRERDYEPAIAHLDRVRSRYPEHPLVLSLLGHAYLESGHAGEAVTALSAATTALPEDVSVTFSLARAHGLNGDAEQAATALRKALEIDPGYYPARLAMARLELNRRNLAAAETQLARLSEDYPEVPAVKALQADLAVAGGHYPKAIGLLEAAVANNPNDLGMHLKLADAHLLDGDGAQALAIVDAWLAEHPEDRRALEFRADKQMLLGQIEDGLATYQTLLRLDPDHISALNNLAWFTREENPTGALALARRAYDVAPQNWAVLHTYCTLLKSSGKSRDGQAMLAEHATRRFAELRAQAGVDSARQTVVAGLRYLLDYDFPEKEEARTLLDSLTR